MPIQINELTDKQLLDVLSYTEGHFLDLKAKDIKPSKLTKAISAFANADGGEVYIGIAENMTLPFPHKWDGFQKPEDANAQAWRREWERTVTIEEENKASRDFFDPTAEAQVIVLIYATTLHKAEQLIESCEHCNREGAEIPFDNILDRITGSDPSVTDYILEVPAKCPNCRREILEKTLIEPT